MSRAHEVQQSLNEVQSLLERLETAHWRSEDWEILQRVLRAYERLLSTLFEAQITLKRLQTLLFGTQRQRRNTATSGASDASQGDTGVGGDAGPCAACGGDEKRGADTRPRSSVGGADDEGKATRSGGHRPGYGRLEAEAYAGAERVACRHEVLAVGERCPVCGQGR